MFFYDINEYVCIDGNDIEITFEQDSHFWLNKGYTEDEMRIFLENSQHFFELFENKEDLSKCKIQGAKEISEGEYVYLHIGNCVNVIKKGNKYICASNGMHRCVVAKKYGLKLLVHIAE